MESWHRVGQRVVCVRDMSPDTKGECLLVGSTWTVSWVGTDEDGDLGFRFVENDPRPFVDGWWVGYFAPVRDTSIDQFEALLNPTPEARRHYLDELAEHAREELEARGWALWY